MEHEGTARKGRKGPGKWLKKRKGQTTKGRKPVTEVTERRGDEVA
jgi:hypothetical protein